MSGAGLWYWQGQSWWEHTLHAWDVVNEAVFIHLHSPGSALFAALNAQAALSQVRERQLAAQSPAPSQTPEVNGASSVALPRPEHCEGAAAGGRAALPPPPVPSVSTPPSVAAVLAPARPTVVPQNTVLRPVLQDAEEAVLTKLRWATNQLQTSASLETSVQLCSLISSCASSLRSLRELSQ